MNFPITSKPGASLRPSSVFREKATRVFAFAAAVAAFALVAPIGALASGNYLDDYDFTGGLDGSFPYAGLTVFGDANHQTATLWGTNDQHGANGDGAVFKYSPFLTSFHAVASFTPVIYSPSSALLPVTFNSIPWGAQRRPAVRGGAAFTRGARHDIGTQPYTDFFGESYGPSGAGTVYRVHPGNPTVQPVWQFTGGNDGKYPEGGLININGRLWGVANGGGGGFGVVFKLNPSTDQLVPVYQFAGGSDGAYPNGLILSNGTLYGATDLGGAANSGTIFSLDPVSGAHHVICGDISANFGVTSPLVSYGAALYFTTWNTGGVHGTLSECSLKTKHVAVAYTFSGGDDGDHPVGSLALHGTVLYGATNSGGSAYHLGNVYSYNLSTGIESPIHEFAPTEGGQPFSGVVYFAGSLWGVTGNGGASDAGTIYSTGLSPASRLRFRGNN